VCVCVYVRIELCYKFIYVFTYFTFIYVKHRVEFYILYFLISMKEINNFVSQDYILHVPYYP